MKRCRKCKMLKDDDCFHHQSNRKDGLKSYCKDCCNKMTIKFNHYTNLQPLWESDNLKKGGTYEFV